MEFVILFSRCVVVVVVVVVVVGFFWFLARRQKWPRVAVIQSLSPRQQSAVCFVATLSARK